MRGKSLARCPRITTMLQTVADSPTTVANPAKQHTLAADVVVKGKGLLLGEEATCTIRPAPANHGIVFERTDLTPPVRIPAHVRHVVERARRTTLKVGSATIETVEHCLSALAGLRIDNALIELAGPELPCGDGSSLPFIEPILEAGIVEQDERRRLFRLREPIVVQEEEAMLAALPHDGDEFRVMFDLDYSEHGNRIARQAQVFDFTNGNYHGDIGPARTFSLEEEARALWDRGMCRHLTPKDVLVIGENGPIDNSYRFDNEPVRHKILDLLGDLYLAGCEVIGRFVAYRSGHSLNHEMARRVVAQIDSVHRRKVLDTGKAMDIRTIHRIMPHRFPMLMVDRVVEIESDRRAIGVKNVTINEPFFQGHYPGTPIMPGVLIVEAMAQLGGLLVSQKLEHTGKIAVLLSLDRVKLRRPVTPGDQLVLEAQTVRASARTANVKCRAYVGSQLAAEAQIKFMMVDAEQD